jgi:hypothetical protein
VEARDSAAVRGAEGHGPGGVAGGVVREPRPEDVVRVFAGDVGCAH